MKREVKLTLTEKTYIPAVLKGMALTFRHIFRPKVTIQYPEERRPLSPRFKGAVRLKKHPSGQIKCVACELCSRICPTQCITVVARESEDRVKEREPEIYQINELRCIYCNFCVEACPVDAIEMSDKFELATHSREEAVFKKEKLLEL